jgi:PAS domain S-box-containing protein
MWRVRTTDAPSGQHDVLGREHALPPEAAVALVSAEDALRQSEERFRGAFDNAPIGMALVAPDGRWLRVNPALCEMLGYTEEELYRKSFQDVTHPEDLADDLEQVQRLLDGTASDYTMEKRYIRADGRIAWAILCVSMVRDRAGEPLYFVSQVMDITERKLAEATLTDRDTIMRAVASCAEALLAAEDWRDAIHAALVELGQGADVSRAHVFSGREDEEGRTRSTLVAEWAAPGVDQYIDHPELRERLPTEIEAAWFAELRSGRIVQAHARELPDEERAIFEAEQIRSLVLVPVFVDGSWWGCLGFDECRTERQWSAAEAEALRTAAGLLGAAIQRTQAETAWRNAESRYRALVDTLPLVTYVDALDQTHTSIYVSPQIEPLLGYSVEEWYSDPTLFERILDPRDRSHQLEGDWPESDGPHRTQYRLRAKDGREVWFLDEYVMVRDDEGNRLYAQGYMLDITEPKRIEDELRHTNEMLNALFQASPLGIIVTDENDRVTFWNQTAERIYGWSAADVVGEYPPTRVEGADDEYRMFRETIDRGETVDGYETRRRHRDGSYIHVSISLAPIQGPSGKPAAMLGLHADITARKLLEAQLMQSQRLEAVGRLAGGIAHDFNNLLTAVSGYAEFLIEGLGEANPLRRDADEIKRAADVAAALVRQLLAFSRRQIVQPRTVDLNEVVRKAESLLRRLVGEDVVLETDLSPDLAPVKADPAQLEQIVVNLAVNARDAMPEGGRLSIQTRAGDSERAICVTVTDTGCGMDEYTRLRAFEPFFTTKAAGQGTGLGLATVYGIVTQAGGTVEVESAPGEGSTFTIVLPALTREGPELRPAVEPASARALTGTVLLVEDEQIVRELAGRALAAAGHTVLEASSGADALLLAGGYPGAIDVLLTDVVMPGMGGRELAERLAAVRPDLRILFTSGYTDDEVWKSDGDGTAFIGKPFTTSALRAKISELLEQRQ